MRISAISALTAFMLFPSQGLAQEPPALGIKGLGQITASTPFDLRDLSAAHRDFHWERSTRQTESGVEKTILANRGGKTAFTVVGHGTRITGVEITSPSIENWLGPVIGHPYGPLHENLQLGECHAGLEHRSGSVLCRAGETDRITYVFTGRWSGPDGELPPATILQTWTISEILWQPAPSDRPASPSFDCSRASGSIEEMICANPDLMALDRQLDRAFRDKLNRLDPESAATERAFQRGWIKGRNDCWKSGDPQRCVFDTYTDRIAELTDTNDPLTGTAWQAIRIAGDVIPPRIDITLNFDSDGRASGSSGCNRYFADITRDGRNLTIGQIGGTRRMCPELEMLAERRFLGALEQIDGWAMRGQDLILFGSGAELTFRAM